MLGAGHSTGKLTAPWRGTKEMTMDPPASELRKWMEAFEKEQRKINGLVATNFRAVRWEGIAIGFFIGSAITSLLWSL